MNGFQHLKTSPVHETDIFIYIYGLFIYNHERQFYCIFCTFRIQSFCTLPCMLLLIESNENEFTFMAPSLKAHFPVFALLQQICSIVKANLAPIFVLFVSSILAGQHTIIPKSLKWSETICQDIFMFIYHNQGTMVHFMNVSLTLWLRCNQLMIRQSLSLLVMPMLITQWLESVSPTNWHGCDAVDF